MLGFGGGRQSSSFAHAFRHWNYFLRHFYSIESTAVIPVNLKIGYEYPVLSRGETRKNPSVHFPRKPPRTVVVSHLPVTVKCHDIMLNN
jgi:hypothetical protein